jgi:hypothetical protein
VVVQIKGKPIERWGRKASDLTAGFSGEGSGAAGESRHASVLLPS